jgi:hypothetical protein
MDHRTTAVTNGPLREAKFHDRPGETPVTSVLNQPFLIHTAEATGPVLPF